MLNEPKGAPHWRNIDAKALALLAGVEPAFLPRYLEPTVGSALTGAAALLLSARARPDKIAKGLAWVRYDLETLGVTALDHDERHWAGMLCRSPLVAGPRWTFTLSAGPFDPDPKRPTRAERPLHRELARLQAGLADPVLLMGAA